MADAPSRTILVLAARSPRAAAVIAEARRLAQALGAPLAVLHVGPDDADSRSALLRAIEDARCDPGRVELLIRQGRVEVVIARCVLERDVELVVAGALEREGVLQYYTLGSVARRVARSSPCPVLLVRQPRLAPEPYRHIVASVHYDAVSSAMLGLVFRLAREEACEVDIISEYESPGLNLMFGDALDSRQSEELRRRLHATEKLRLSAFVDAVRPEDVGVRLHCLPGRHGTATIEHVHKSNADLLCFPHSSAPLTFWDKLFRHGVEYALERLPCDLLLFRPQAARVEASEHQAGPA